MSEASFDNISVHPSRSSAAGYGKKPGILRLVRLAGRFATRLIVVQMLAVLALVAVAHASSFTGTVAHNHPVEYIVPTNAGDNLMFTLASTNPPNNQLTELDYYDANGTLVAVASGNASDGYGSVIDFTTGVPGLSSLFVIDPIPGQYDFSLQIIGNTGGAPYPAVPEPSSMVLFASGLLGACGVLRRQLLP